MNSWIRHFLIDRKGPKFCTTIVSNLSWELQSSQDKFKTMVMQNFLGENKSR